MTQPNPLVRELIDAIGAEAVVWQAEDLLVYEYDATIDRGKPEAIALPATTDDVVALMQICNRHNVPITPRGAGTGLSGGALATRGGVVFGMNRMRRILEIDVENKTARVQPGVVNLDLGDRGRALRPRLRTGPEQPARLHDRRQRRRERRRPAHARLGHDDQSRARADAGDP